MNTSIKALIDHDYLIICDTNVYLRIYDYSPEFADFSIKCLSAVKNSLYITYTTSLEYGKNYRGKYSDAKTKIENYNRKLDEITEKYKDDISKEFERIRQYHFPDMDGLENIVVQKIKELKDLFEEYHNTHELLIAVNEQYLNVDPIKAFIDSMTDKVLIPYSIDKIYEICDEGKKRFKNNTPPGFKDKHKDGIRQYSDLILWKELMEFSVRTNKNIIFVTDDVKNDWWSQVKQEDGTTVKAFHPTLINEFEGKTSQKIIALTSNEFFTFISDDYDITISDAVNMALAQTIGDYVNEIKWAAFDKISHQIVYYPEEYIDDTSADIGSEGLTDCELDDYELVEYSLFERNEAEMVYSLIYNVTLTATSCDYWGRDEDTKEIITSPPNEHTFEGIIELHVKRTVDDFVDLLYENNFDDVDIVSGKLEQTNFVPGFENDFDYEEAENYCPKCGKAISFENDALNGFCQECTNEFDI